MRSLPTRGSLALLPALAIALGAMLLLVETQLAPAVAVADSPVQVRVVDQATQVPVPAGITVTAHVVSGFGTGSSAAATTDATGTATFSLRGPAGYSFGLDHPAWMIPPGPFPPATNVNGTDPVNTTLTARRVQVNGRVEGSDGTLLDGAWVRFEGTVSHDPIIEPVQPDGTFRLAGPLASGPHEFNVFFQSTGGSADLFTSPEPKVVTITVDANGIIVGGPLDAGTITLPRAVKFIKGIVQRPDGGPIGSATAFADRPPADPTDPGTQREHIQRSVVTTTNAFTIPVKPGSWDVNVSPQGSAANDWMAPQPPVRVLFADDNSVETRFVTLTVNLPQVTGKVVAEGGAPLQSGWVDLFSRNYSLRGEPLDSEGAFRLSGIVEPGEYTLVARPCWGCETPLLRSEPLTITASLGPTGTLLLSAAVRPTGTLVSGPAPLNVGVLTLPRAVKFIRGTIQRTDGGTLGPTRANAFPGAGGGPYDSFGASVPGAGSTAVFTLGVRPGTWNVSIGPDFHDNPSADWVYASPPTQVSFLDDGAVETRLVTFTISGAQLSGRVAARDGAAVTFGNVNLFNRDRSVNLNAPIRNGTFRLSGIVSSDEYFLVAYPCWDCGLPLLHSDPLSMSVRVEPSAVVITTTLRPTGTVVSRPAPLDVGTLILPEPVKFIAGLVQRTDGGALGQTGVSAFPSAGGGPGGDFFGTNISGTTSATFTIGVRPGTWAVNTSPDRFQNASADWIYTDPAPTVAFADDDKTETRRVTLTVRGAPFTALARVRLPDGTPPPDDVVFISLNDRSAGFGRGEPVMGGIFSMRLPTGTYTVDVWSKDPRFGLPPGGLPTFSVPVSGTTGTSTYGLGVNGVITLTQRTSSIGGMVQDPLGKGVGGINVNAWNRVTNDHASTTTDASGKFTLMVGGGTYDVDAFPPPGVPWSRVGTVQSITVGENDQKTGVLLSVTTAETLVNVEAIGADGKPLSNAQGFAHARKAESRPAGPPPVKSSADDFAPGEPIGNGEPLVNGKATLRLPEVSNIIVDIFFPPGSDYLPAQSDPITTTKGSPQTVKIPIGRPDATISGFLKTRGGTTITGVRAQVFAHSGGGGAAPVDVDPATGQYAARVKSGQKVFIGIFIDPSQPYRWVQNTIPEVSIPAGDTSATYDFELVRTDARIEGLVTDPGGNPLSGAFVSASLPPSGTIPPRFVGGMPTGPDGTFTINVEGGKTYQVHAGTSPERGFVNPAGKDCVVPASGSCAVNFQFSSSDAKLVGTVLSGTTGVQTFVRAWSDNGANAFGRSLDDGRYSLGISTGGAAGDTWHVSAVYETPGAFASTAEVAVPVTSTTRLYTRTLTLRALANLPKPINVTYDATELKIILLENGAKIAIPAGALATSGKVTVRAAPNPSLPSQRHAQPFGIGYTLQAADGNGSPITRFNSNVTIEIPYDPTKLPSGQTEDTLVPSFFNSSTGTWQQVDNFTIDKVNRRAVVLADHFTDFSIMSATPSATIESFAGYLPVVLDALTPSGW